MVSDIAKAHAFRWDDGPDFDWLSDPDLAYRAEQLNDSDDVIGMSHALGGGGFFHYSERDSNGVEIGATYQIKDLVSDPLFDDSVIGNLRITERDSSLSTPAPIIVGNNEINANGADEWLFILIPKELP